jgi:ferric iron reductase protein FhuF
MITTGVMDRSVLAHFRHTRRDLARRRGSGRPRSSGDGTSQAEAAESKYRDAGGVGARSPTVLAVGRSEARNEVLDDGAAWGPRFVASVGVPDGPGWVAAEALFGAQLDDALDRVGKARGTQSSAVAGSLLVEAYAQRVVAPVLGAFFVDGRVLDARLPQVWTEPVEGGVRRIAFAEAPTPAAPHARAETSRMRAGLIEGNLDHVVRAVHERTRVGRRVLRGAVANAVANTFLHLSWPDADRARHVDTARAFLAEVPGLAELVGIEAVVEGGRPWMYTERHTCCLAFRTDHHRAHEQPYCATCPVLPRVVTRDMFSRATASYAERHPDG